MVTKNISRKGLMWHVEHGQSVNVRQGKTSSTSYPGLFAIQNQLVCIIKMASRILSYRYYIFLSLSCVRIDCNPNDMQTSRHLMKVIMSIPRNACWKETYMYKILLESQYMQF